MLEKGYNRRPGGIYMIYGYIRVSTDKQTVENQRFEINRFIKKTGVKVDSWIEETIKGIHVDYLDRKSREVINMLSAKYNYKLDIAVKKEEAFQDGMEHKAIEDARNFYANGVSVEIIAKSLGMTEDQVRQIVNESVVVKE